jgi:tetratricopeptide (TPR) repeat protein
MAFGFGFNKQKVLSTAEKYVQQGKLQNAIAEYEKVTKNDPKDLTVTNTIGDLYSRLGDQPKAVECFKSVGDAYASQGFTVKAIAMYKKISKLQPTVDSALKLAELYTQQGLFNDARAQYLQVAEDLMKGRQLDQAVRLFQKVLEMDPENVPMRTKLAEVYIRLGKKKEAWELYSAAAESLRSRGSLAAAEDILQKMLSLDPGNSYALLLRGRAAIEGDDPKKAIQYLEKAADLDSHPDGLRDLMKAYFRLGRFNEAGTLAEKLLNVHNDPEALFALADGYTQAGKFHEALDVYSKHADRMLAADCAKLLASLHTMIGHVRDDAGALDVLLQLLQKSGESTHVGEVTELLAHASVKNGDLNRAGDLYQMLATIEPQNALHTQNYQQVMAKMDASAPMQKITAEEGAVIVDELEATAPVVDQTYPDDIAIAVRSAVTDADLFLSYNLPDKAIVPLLGALPQAPRDVRLNQRLAALHTRAERFTEAAVCCRNLESVYSESGYPDEASRYGELAARYEERAGVAASAPPVDEPAPMAASAVQPASSPAAPAAPELQTFEVTPATPQSHTEFAIEAPAPAHDSSDLSAEWDQSFSVEPPAAVAPTAPLAIPPQPVAQQPAPAGLVAAPASESVIAETVEEVRFYLEHYMADQARSALAKLKTLTSDPAILGPLGAEIEVASAQPTHEAEISEISADGIPSFEAEEEPAPAAGEHAAPAKPQPSVPAAPLHKREPEPAVAHADKDELSDLVADLEASLADSFPAATPEPEPVREPLPAWPSATPKPAAPRRQTVPTPQPEPAVFAHAALPPVTVSAKPAVAATSSGAAAAVAPALSYSQTPVRPLGAGAQAMHAPQSVDLSEMFGELKKDLEEEPPIGDGDPETHYNLGVAFREMGLLDEAIAELQKVCASIDRGQPFPQTVQTYTWLAQCFLDKGVPEAAIRWYEKALGIPNLDQESRLAIHYELGSACETSHDKPAALRHFTEVYGANIDYRDVAERIQALKS